ncbi:MAG: ferric reductase-like transmembrane domain-containing protein [Candidatus Dormibacteraeota bacterium]|nr:ferric reductase-like transmembrane domain-containing protein [Candidatus Dormibacteraeota bacterium]
MTAPSPFWYATRGAGLVLLLLLTAVVILGILTTNRWGTARIPRFVGGALHRNLSLLTLVFLALHIVTSIVDSFAHLGLKDALIPFASDYRPFWMGVGVLGAELFVALVITSLIRRQLGYRLWRLTHWLAYASWPLALVHGLGTGSDTKAGWALVLNGVCVVSVLLVLGWRLALGTPQSEPVRLAGLAGTAVATLALVVWMIGGPLKPGWAHAAGTPASLLAQLAAPASTAAALPKGLSDQLQGTLTRDSAGGLRLDLRDVPDASLRVLVSVADSQATSARVEVRRNGQTICASSVPITQQITATCGTTHFTLQNLQQEGGSQVQGMLVTSAS